MTSMTKPMSDLSRRALLAGLGALALAPAAAWAFDEADARHLIQKVIDEIQRIINSGASEAQMLREFEGIFDRYGDTKVIGQLVLGPDGRRATPAQKAAFAEAFKIYISHKYGRRFREFIGARIDIGPAKKVKRYWEVQTTTHLKGQAPFQVDYVVSERSGKFIDIRIEGISLIKSERAEIGAMLDKRRGDLDRLIADLRKM